MNLRRICGIVVFFAGALMLGFSYYITEQVLSGKQQIRSAQKKVDMGNQIFSNSSGPVKDIGESMTDSAQNKINAGKDEVASYEAMATSLKIGGYVAMAIGAITVLIPRKKRR